MKRFRNPLKNRRNPLRGLGGRLRALWLRATTTSALAHWLMVSFVLWTSVGADLIYLPAGLIVLGLTSGVYGYLLGAD